MRRTRLVFVEGVIGAGKTATVQRLAAELGERRIAASAIAEGDPKLRVARSLTEPFAPWSTTTIDQYIELCRLAWARFTAESTSHVVFVSDGLLFHGNMTDLFLADASYDELSRYLDGVLSAIAVMEPSLIYLDQTDIAASLRATANVRGQRWIDYQVGWKLKAPYAQTRALSGLDGLIAVYEGFTATCRAFVGEQRLPTLVSYDTEAWPRRVDAMRTWLELR
ncbi:MAG TPA: hypothetical protein VEU77_09945 [Candidatus Acidoferrales bacterium]|nr:hypothetical protein [Candidatus Acidoferrales bacterium]